MVYTWEWASFAIISIVENSGYTLVCGVSLQVSK